MNLSRNLRISVLMTIVTTLLLGVGYPLLITGLAQALFPAKANGQLIERNGRLVGSRLIGQGFSSVAYFHGRPSAAGAGGYDPAASGGTNLGPTSKKLADTVKQRVTEATADNPGAPVPIDLVTASASGLDPDVSPDATLFQVPRVSRARNIGDQQLRAVVEAHIEWRQFGLLGEPRVNVLELNLALDERWPIRK
jgi:K+-transporting ATPase ATPase C chain